MFTKLIWDGAVRIVQIISYKNKKRIARIYDPKGVIPEAVLYEIQDNQFLDTISDKSYQLTPLGMIGI